MCAIPTSHIFWESLISPCRTIPSFSSCVSYKNRNKSDEKITSDCLEALIGAIYIDNGFKIAEKFVLATWRKHIEKSIETYIDSKTKLQEFCLKKYKELPKYLTYSKTGPNHDPSFKVGVTIPNSKKVLGVGKSIKIAQQNAATKLLEILKISIWIGKMKEFYF